MIGYNVYRPDKKYSFGLNRVDTMVFVRDGFAWLAVLSPLLWSLYHRMWLVALFVLAAILLVTGIVWLFDLSQIQNIVAVLVLNIIFAIEASAIRGWYIGQKGFSFAGFVTGDSQTECQRRFYRDFLDKEKIASGGQESQF